VIDAVVFSYKNKNLKACIDQMLLNTQNNIFITVFDKHNLNRKDLFSEAKYFQKVDYKHVFWDELHAPATYKANLPYNSKSKYFLFFSDDIFVSKDWDKKLINFIEKNPGVVSGKGSLELKKKNEFYFDQIRKDFFDFTKTNFVDKNFIFGKTETLLGVYPTEFKYFGEDEIISLNLFRAGTAIFSCPSEVYKDLKIRTIENEYVPFSLEHNYNKMIDEYMVAPKEFLNLLGVANNMISKLPYSTNDVSYDPDSLKFQNMDGRRFLINVTEIS
jgi:hypothetical protein